MNDVVVTYLDGKTETFEDTRVCASDGSGLLTIRAHRTPGTHKVWRIPNSRISRVESGE